eukprot:840097-Rhodomonas_salina.1
MLQVLTGRWKGKGRRQIRNKGASLATDRVGSSQADVMVCTAASQRVELRPGHREILVEVEDPSVPRSRTGSNNCSPPHRLSQFPLTLFACLPESAVVVGSGIVGLSVAEALARRGCKVRVVDRLPEPRGEATPRSWAWINANSKR